MVILKYVKAPYNLASATLSGDLDQWQGLRCLSLSYDPLLTGDHSMSICSDVCHDLLLISDQSSDVCHSPMIHSWSVTVEVCHSPMICSWSMTKTCVPRSYDLLLIDDPSMSVTLLWSTLDYSNQDPSCITLLWSSLDQLPDSWWLSLSYDPFLIKDHCSVSLSYDPLLISCQIPDGCPSPMFHSWSVTTVVCHLL